MRNYQVQYVREQRVYRTILAKSAEEAYAIMDSIVALLDLSSVDDESDDPGEVTVMGWPDPN